MGQADLPLANGARHVKAFQRAGWVKRRETRGSHVILEKDGVAATLSIPNHKGKDVKRGLLMRQIQNAGMSVDDYLACFK